MKVMIIGATTNQPLIKLHKLVISTFTVVSHHRNKRLFYNYFLVPESYVRELHRINYTYKTKQN